MNNPVDEIQYVVRITTQADRVGQRVDTVPEQVSHRQTMGESLWQNLEQNRRFYC